MANQDIIYDLPAKSVDLEAKLYNLFNLARLGVAAADTNMTISKENVVDDLQQLLEFLARELYTTASEAGDLQIELRRQSTTRAA